MKTNQIHHETLHFDGVGVIDVSRPASSDHVERPPIEIIGGLTSVKGDYENQADELAVNGEVYNLSFNTDFPGRDELGALQARQEAARRSVDALASRTKDGLWVVTHSLGAPTAAPLLEDSPVEIVKADFICPAGFDKVRSHEIDRPIGFLFTEMLPYLPKLIRQFRNHADGIEERLDLVREIREAFDLIKLDDNYMINFVNNAHKADLPMRFFLGPKDRLVKSKRVRAVLESSIASPNIIDIHPNAGHLAPQIFYGHMAKLILGGFDANGQYISHEGKPVAKIPLVHPQEFAIAA